MADPATRSWKLSVSGFAICLVALVALGLLGKPTGNAGLVTALVLLGSFVFFTPTDPGPRA